MTNKVKRKTAKKEENRVKVAATQTKNPFSSSSHQLLLFIAVKIEILTVLYKNKFYYH